MIEMLQVFSHSIHGMLHNVFLIVHIAPMIFLCGIYYVVRATSMGCSTAYFKCFHIFMRWSHFSTTGHEYYGYCGNLLSKYTQMRPCFVEFIVKEHNSAIPIQSGWLVCTLWLLILVFHVIIIFDYFSHTNTLILGTLACEQLKWVTVVGASLRRSDPSNTKGSHHHWLTIYVDKFFYREDGWQLNWFIRNFEKGKFT